MLPLSIKAAFRQLWKNRLFSVVNLLGLSMGLASAMALLVGVYMYFTADNIHRDKDRMYYLKSVNAAGSQFMQTTYPLLDEILKSCPEVEAGTHIQTWSYPWLKYGEKEAQESSSFVDTGFFHVFSFPLKYGNPATALRDKFSVVISEKVATQLFGNENPLGKVIRSDDTVQLTITGVLQTIPTNSSVRSEVFLTTALLKDYPGFAQAADWYNGFATNFLKFKPGANIKAFDAKLAEIVALNYAPGRKTDKVRAVAFSNMRNEAGPVVSVIINGSMATAGFILLIVLVNLLNLNAASMYNRSKEVAVRQMIGSGKWKIVKQFCLENGILVLVSVLLAGLLFMNILLPRLNEMYGSRFGELSLSLRQDYPFVILIVVVGIFIAILAGALPAFKLISLRVSDAVKGKITHRGSTRWRNIFIGIQFTLAIVFICITVILNRQINYMKSASLGFEKENVTVVNLDLAFKNEEAATAHFKTVVSELQSLPYVSSVSTNSVIPTAYWDNYNAYVDLLTNKEMSLRHAGADVGYLATFNIPLIEGRNFDATLDATEKKSVIINRAAMNAYGWTSAVGKQIREKGSEGNVYTVIGVTEDFHYQDMQKGIEPMLHWYAGKQSLSNNKYLTIRTQGEHTNQLAQVLQQAFKSMPSRRPFKYERMPDLVSKQYAMIDGILTTTNFVALLTILVSCMGMFGLISLFAKQRVKEIGVRKVLGAKVSQIVLLLGKDFVKLLLVACVVAFPIALFAMQVWLNSFAYRIHIKWWMFGLADLVAIAIAVVTILLQAVRAAMANPVKALRTE